jgi:hypothetical protein
MFCVVIHILQFIVSIEEIQNENRNEMIYECDKIFMMKLHPRETPRQVQEQIYSDDLMFSNRKL